jgi:glycosyltransferase involved in cell wall biosynthesis
VVRAIFSATAAGLPWPSAKQQIVGHGIDTAQFAPDGAIDRTLVTAVGRLTPVKHFPQIIEAFSTLPPQMRLRIVGDAFTVADQAEKRNILALAKQRGVSDRIEIGFLPHHELPALLARSVLSLHACAGGLDKALLEAMAAGCPVVSTSQAGTLVLPPLCQATPETFAAKALTVLDLSDDARRALGEELRAIVVKDHSLERLIRRLVEAMALTPGASRLR